MSDRRLRRLGGASGIAGPLALTIYFTAPAVTGWPYAGASPDQLIQYATSHQSLFFAGAWFQATGAMLSVLFFLVLIELAGARSRLSGSVAIVGSALLLAVVVVEAALLVAVPMGAANHDAATVATTFALSNGVFVRVFPLAPAPLLFAGVGAALIGGTLLHRWFAWSAFAVAALFELAGIAAIFSAVGLYFAIAMSILQEFWILAAAIATLLSTRDQRSTYPDTTRSGT